MGWDQSYLDEQNHRLRHARAHCDFYLMTDDLTEDQVLARVLEFLAGLTEPKAGEIGD
jgi:ATP-dependent Clp protease adapter protein ClpS